MKRASLPLGVDIGATRVRVAHVELGTHGAQIRAVAVRELESQGDVQYLAALIDDAVNELGSRERRCVCALGEPDAVVRSLTLPNMTSVERERAARFEARRYIDYPVEEAIVRTHPVDRAAGVWALGIARSSAVQLRTAAIRAAGLKPVAIDHEALAFSRVLPAFDAVLDVGHQRTSLHVGRAGATPVTLQAYTGGADLTRAIERDLLIDARTAEKRKRILGTAGAGERARAALTADIASLVESARTNYNVRRVALVGNAARLAGLAADVELTTGALCEIAVSDALRGDAYPDDVIRSSAPDWTLAAALACWSLN